MAKPDFKLSLQQAVMLESAFIRNGWSVNDVLQLCEGDLLAQILSVLPVGKIEYQLRPVGISLEFSELSIRPAKILKSQGIFTVTQLTEKTKWQLLSFMGFGKTSLDEVEAFLKERGLSLAETPQKPT